MNEKSGALRNQQVKDEWWDVYPDDGDMQLHLRHWAGEKRPFVLLHGLASNNHTWDMVAVELANAGHEVIAVNQRGHGLSDKPAAGYDFATITDDLLLLLDRMGVDQPFLAGQSWGGNVVLAFAARYPRRVQGLIFVDGGYLDFQMLQDPNWERVEQQLRPPMLTGMARDTLKARIQSLHDDWDEEGIEATLANFETPRRWHRPPMVVAGQTYGDCARTVGTATFFPLSPGRGAGADCCGGGFQQRGLDGNQAQTGGRGRSGPGEFAGALVCRHRT